MSIIRNANRYNRRNKYNRNANRCTYINSCVTILGRYTLLTEMHNRYFLRETRFEYSLNSIKIILLEARVCKDIK